MIGIIKIETITAKAKFGQNMNDDEINIIIKDLDIAIKVSRIFEDREKIDLNQFIDKDKLELSVIDRKLSAF